MDIVTYLTVCGDPAYDKFILENPNAHLGPWPSYLGPDRRDNRSKWVRSQASKKANSPITKFTHE